ncbi:bifunctional riboflavin biosynthesis protein RIBA 1, chloroplastic-like protein [Tanacetum coccineum]
MLMVTVHVSATSKSALGNLQYQKWFLERFNAAFLKDEVLYHCDWRSIGGIYASLLLIFYFFIGLSVPSAFVLWIMRELPPSMTISVQGEKRTLAFVSDYPTPTQPQHWTTIATAIGLLRHFHSHWLFKITYQYLIDSIPEDSSRSAASVSNSVKQCVKILTQGDPQARKQPFQKVFMLTALILSEVFGSDADHFSNDTENPNDYTGLKIFDPVNRNTDLILTVLKTEMLCKSQQDEPMVKANEELGLPVDSRESGIGAQVLRDLGVRTMKLMTKNPAKYSGITGYGFEVVGRDALLTPITKPNKRYLETKQAKMGHVYGSGNNGVLNLIVQNEKPTTENQISDPCTAPRRWFAMRRVNSISNLDTEAEYVGLSGVETKGSYLQDTDDDTIRYAGSAGSYLQDTDDTARYAITGVVEIGTYNRTNVKLHMTVVFIKR